VGPLSERFRVINVDLPGHGESPPRDGGHTMEQYARDLKHLLTELELEGAVLVGWSMGSFVIWDLIKQFGVEGLAGHVIVDCGPTDLNQDGWELGVWSLEEVVAAVADVQVDHRAAAEGVLPYFFKQLPAEAERRMLIDQMASLGANATACSLVSQSVCDYREVIGTYSLPTLCVWGRHDQALPVANAAWLAKHVPAEVVFLEQSGHCSMWEEPDLFNQAVGDWIASRG
jgi:non-heme chloroperoxidase